MKNLLIITLLGLGLFCGFVFYKTGNVPVQEWSEQLQRDGVMGTFKKISAGQFVAQAKEIVKDVTGDSIITSPATPVQIYKWTDANGVVHYDNQPVKGATTLSINPNENVVPMEKAAAVAADPAPVEPILGDQQQKEMLENIEKIKRAREARAGL
ncbi:MAG: DUF4124 domain-containing protein [Pseudomonadota bacterium]